MVSDILRGPSNVVVGYHRSFWWTGSARGVDESRTISGLNLMTTRINRAVTLDRCVIHTFTTLQKYNIS